MLFRRKEHEPVNLKLVVGLGNIGAGYVGTRHNVGFVVADELARRHGGRFRKGKFRGEEVTLNITGERVLVLKPHTLMNLSGEAVVAAARFYRLQPEQILVICDDVYLPVGKLRLRAKGSPGGHNGLWSISNRLNSQDYPRLRIGVGEVPPEMDMADYVLGRFTGEERRLIEPAYDRAASAVEDWISQGIEFAMNRWNAGA